ncbi:MAG TPA: response regulator [Terriglobales bacterium]|nr:response regulator [Terriglobales bacterium]
MPKKALVVDDSVTMRQMVSFTLREANFEVLEAENGQDALKKIEGQALDLIVTDLNMPVMDGITFIRQARALPATKYVPILMLTTESQTGKKMEGKAAGATGWIVKPFDPPKLLTVVAKVLP